MCYCSMKLILYRSSLNLTSLAATCVAQDPSLLNNNCFVGYILLYNLNLKRNMNSLSVSLRASKVNPHTEIINSDSDKNEFIRKSLHDKYSQRKLSENTDFGAQEIEKIKEE